MEREPSISRPDVAAGGFLGRFQKNEREMHRLPFVVMPRLPFVVSPVEPRLHD